MNPRRFLFWMLLLTACLAGVAGVARADGRAGIVEWSDARKLTGAISLTPGSLIRLFDGKEQTSLRLEDIREISMTIEKEELAEGFFFPEPGKAIKEKTGEVFPVRYYQARVTMGDGREITGHIFTTVLYVETPDNTEKVVLLAKQTGLNGQKLADVVYPTAIRFSAAPTDATTARIDLRGAGLPEIRRIVAVVKPALGFLHAQPEPGMKAVWTVPSGDPAGVLFAVECSDGLHVAWPAATAEDKMPAETVAASLKVMEDFYDTRTLLATFYDAEAGDVYGVVYMFRAGETHSFGADKQPWSVVILRWQYDADEKKATLLNRVTLSTGRKAASADAPKVFADAKLLKYISAVRSAVSEKPSTP